MARSVETPLPAVNPKPARAVDQGRWSGWLARLWPGRCLVCDARGDGGRDLCAACASALPANRICCPRCALPLATPASACGACLRRPPAYDWARAPFRYAFPLDRLLSRFKYSGDLASGRLLAALIADTLVATPAPIDRTWQVLPVPLALDRLAERGFNQALELARPLAQRLGLPLTPDALIRRRATPRQAGLPALERRRNLRAAFVADPAVAGRRLLLIDDVMTTGATLGECARGLRRAGAVEIGVVVVARAPSHR